MNFKRYIQTIFSCSRFRPGIEKNSTRKFLNCVNFSFLRRISGIEEDGDVKKREKSEKERERDKHPLSNLSDRIIRRNRIHFRWEGTVLAIQVASPSLKLRYTSMECSTDGEHVTIASNIRNQFASLLMDE